MGRSAADILIEHGVGITDEELGHAGVKGMRWGRRKKKSSSGEDSGPPKPNVKTMSDDDLRNAINRIKMEKEFAKLTAPEVSRGRQIVGKMLLEVGQEVGKEYVKSHAKRLILEGGTKGAIAVAKSAITK
jgi:hypothetical protein